MKIAEKMAEGSARNISEKSTRGDDKEPGADEAELQRVRPFLH